MGQCEMMCVNFNEKLNYFLAASRTHTFLQKLHWLPIEKRIKFKIILLTFKLHSGSAPSYLTDLIHTYVPSRSLRSENQHLLQVPRFTTEHCGKRSFAVLAPTLWNNLPLCIRTEPSTSLFISKLKTHLFTN